VIPGISRIDGDLRHRGQETSAPGTDALELAADLALEIPRQDQDIVRTELHQRLRRYHRDVGTGQELALLVGISVRHQRDIPARDAAEVEQRVAFGGRAIRRHALRVALRPCEKLQQ
jgi:hypothetical protein